MATATAWVRSLSCKYSTAVADDAYSPLLPPPPKKHPMTPQVKAASAVSLLLPERDRERESRRSRSMSSERDRPAAARRNKKKNKDATSELASKPKPRQQLAASLERPSSAFLEMTELPEGHPSRRVVELIFASGWALAADDQAPGEVEVEALFRVRSTARAVARFEAARAAARARGEAASDARCAADGNEVMRFQCRRAAEAGGGSEVICAAVATCHRAGSARAVRTFAGSGAADAGAGGEGCDGRRGMLVCRVIAGCVRPADTQHLAEDAGEYDSVDAGGGELVVLDRRAVLPCFLVVYNVNPPKLLESSSSRRSG